MKRPRFGPGTSIYYLAFAMFGIIAISIWLSAISIPLCLFVGSLWVLFCSLVVDPWFFPVGTKKYTWKSENSILVSFDSDSIWMERGKNRDRQVFGLEPKNQNGKKTIWVYDHQALGNDRHLDGLEVNMIWLNVGKIVAKRTNDGFLVSWEESVTPWNVVGEKKEVK